MFYLATWSNPQTLLLNLTNLGLGVFTLAVLFRIAWACVREALS